MYCNACGKMIGDDARYCAYCGAVVGHPLPPRKLMRPRAHRTIGGVCAAMGPYLNVDVTLIRLIWVLVVIFSGIFPGVLVYALAWVIIPEEPEYLPVAVGQVATNP